MKIMSVMQASRRPGKDEWKSTGIKGDRYELRTNGNMVTIWLDGKQLPYQTDVTWNQKMDNAVSVNVTFLFG